MSTVVPAVESPERFSSGMRCWLQVAATVAGADIRSEARRPVALAGVVLFSVGALVVVHLAVAGAGSVEPRVAAGTIWVVLLLGALLATTRGVAAASDEHTWDALLLGTSDRSAIFIGKSCSAAALCGGVHLFTLAAFCALFRSPPDAASMGLLLASVLIADITFAAVGTLVGVVGLRARGRELLVATAFLPLSLPTLVVAVSVALTAFGVSEAPVGTSLAFLVGIAAVFVATGVAAVPEIATE